MATTEVPADVFRLSLGERIAWARRHAGLSHDRLVMRLGRSNRSHLIKIEKGEHIPRQDLRDAIADAAGVPRDLFADDPQEAALSGDPFLAGHPRGAEAARGPAEAGDGARPVDVTKDAA
jgi:transcriptional regulator with XRE-family HTH domain